MDTLDLSNIWMTLVQLSTINSVSKMDLVNWNKHWINKLVSIAENISKDFLLQETDTLPKRSI